MVGAGIFALLCAFTVTRGAQLSMKGDEAAFETAPRCGPERARDCVALRVSQVADRKIELHRRKWRLEPGKSFYLILRIPEEAGPLSRRWPVGVTERDYERLLSRSTVRVEVWNDRSMRIEVDGVMKWILGHGPDVRTTTCIWFLVLSISTLLFGAIFGTILVHRWLLRKHLAGDEPPSPF